MISSGILADIKQAASILATQRANVVFYRRVPYHNKFRGSEVPNGSFVFGFRRGTMPVEVPPEFIKNFLDCVGDREILFSLHHSEITSEQIQEAFCMAMAMAKANIIEIENVFKSQGITARHDFIKGLMIAAYGTMGELMVIDPQYGVENISHYLLRNTDSVDCRVFNPNLGGIEKLEHILKNENKKFDFIGMSPGVLESDMKVMSMVEKLCPAALKIAGGSIFDGQKPEEFLQSFSVDVAVEGPGEDVMLKIVEMMKENRNTVIDRLKGMTKVWVYREGKVFSPIPKGEEEKRTIVPLDPCQDDVPLQEEDVYHQTSYLAFRRWEGMMQGDHIGRNPITVMLKDNCFHGCRFCVTPKNQNLTEEQEQVEIVKKIIAKIEKERSKKDKDGQPVYDSVQVLDNNFATYPEMLEMFCRKIIDSQEIINGKKLKDIPKSCKIHPGDLCKNKLSAEPDTKLIQLLADAGFKRIYLGVESFRQEALDLMGKDTTVDQNRNVLNALIAAKIKPGINLIMFGGLDNDSEDGIFDTTKWALHYVEEDKEYGATLNVMDFIWAYPRSSLMKVIDPEKNVSSTLLMREGMRAPYKKIVFFKPKLGPLLDFEEEAINKKNDFIRFLHYQYPFLIFSKHVDSLALCWAIARLKGNDDLAEQAEWEIDEHMVEQNRDFLNFEPYKKTSIPELRNMRHSFIDGEFLDSIIYYNLYLEKLYESNSGKFESNGLNIDDLFVNPYQLVVNIPKMAQEIKRVVEEMEKGKGGNKLRIRLAGYPATGKTMLRRQLKEKGLEFELCHLDRYRNIPKGNEWKTKEEIEKTYDLGRLKEQVNRFPEDRRVLYEGTWALAPEFSILPKWDLSIAFEFSLKTWRRSFWFRQILFRRKGLDNLLPSQKQKQIHDRIFIKYIDDVIGNADIVIGETGRILPMSDEVEDILKRLGIQSLDKTHFIDQLKCF